MHLAPGCCVEGRVDDSALRCAKPFNVHSPLGLIAAAAAATPAIATGTVEREGEPANPGGGQWPSSSLPLTPFREHKQRHKTHSQEEQKQLATNTSAHRSRESARRSSFLRHFFRGCAVVGRHHRHSGRLT